MAKLVPILVITLAGLAIFAKTASLTKTLTPRAPISIHQTATSKFTKLMKNSLNGNTTIAACSSKVHNCLECHASNPDSCSTCKRGFILNTTQIDNFCQHCPVSCTTCGNNSCEGCIAHNYLTLLPTYRTEKPTVYVCEECDINCKTCSRSAKRCLTCSKDTRFDPASQTCQQETKLFYILLFSFTGILVLIVLVISLKACKSKKNKNSKKGKIGDEEDPVMFFERGLSEGLSHYKEYSESYKTDMSDIGGKKRDSFYSNIERSDRRDTLDFSFEGNLASKTLIDTIDEISMNQSGELSKAASSYQSIGRPTFMLKDEDMKEFSGMDSTGTKNRTETTQDMRSDVSDVASGREPSRTLAEGGGSAI